MQRIVILGAGFAGLWTALGAARALDERGIGPERVEILVIDRNPYHAIRVRNYEADLQSARVPLADVLGPVAVRHAVADVTDIDVAQREVAILADGRPERLSYDRLVVALGSTLPRPAIPGAEYCFDVDTYTGAARLADHLAMLPARAASPGQFTAVVVGAGFTGIEVAAELIARLERVRASGTAHRPPPARVVLVDRRAAIGADMGEAARTVIARALAALGVETRAASSLRAVEPDGAILSDGERIDAATVVWCAGMRAHSLAARIPVERDPLGRLPVDATMRIRGVADAFAAGDVAWFPVDGSHASVMSCQHSRPMGRFAGHNVVCDLLNEPMLPLSIGWYNTILDLGAWGAVYTEGWERRLVAEGAAAKLTKETINRRRIYPPPGGDRRALLDAAAPLIQAPPPVGVPPRSGDGDG
ncbi:MAG: FAD-dependent oxidoreductase [Acetobacteraceae bacterium]